MKTVYFIEEFNLLNMELEIQRQKNKMSLWTDLVVLVENLWFNMEISIGLFDVIPLVNFFALSLLLPAFVIQ